MSGTEEDRNVFVPEGWTTIRLSSGEAGWYLVWAKAEWPTAERCKIEVERVLHGFCDGRLAFIRRKPVVVSDKDFDTKAVRHRGSVRFSFKTEPGDWTYPEPDDGTFVGFGIAGEASP